MIFFSLASQRMGTIQLKIQQNVCAAMLLFSTLALRGESFALPLEWGGWLAVGTSAFLGITLSDSLYIAAIKRIGAAKLALVDGLYLPFVIILAHFFLGEKINGQVYLGASFVLTAVIFAHLPFRKENWRNSEDRIGLVYAILCQFLMAVCVLLLKPILPQVPILALTAWRFLLGSVFLIAPLLLRGQLQMIISSFSRNLPWHLTLPGVLLGPFLATLLWFAGFKYAQASRAAIFNQLSTVLGVIFAGIFLREPLDRMKWLALLLAVTGGFIVFFTQQVSPG